MVFTTAAVAFAATAAVITPSTAATVAATTTTSAFSANAIANVTKLLLPLPPLTRALSLATAVSQQLSGPIQPPTPPPVNPAVDKCTAVVLPMEPLMQRFGMSMPGQIPL
ncbi:hypothetical protein ECG_09953 [Echinococcus granulosus]|nr:hypothetical protein ECG_09953 [Echinococcus granulosus]